MTAAELLVERRNFVCGRPCALCGGLPHDVHEICGGASRRAAFQERACWLAVCREPCHRLVQGADIEYQLALKLLSDPEGWNLEAFCKAWNRPLSAVDTAGIVIHLREILLER